jgi:hypothetical protein
MPPKVPNVENETSKYDALTPNGQKAYAHDRDVESANSVPKGHWPSSLNMLMHTTKYSSIK